METSLKETQHFVQESTTVQEKLLKTILKKLSKDRVKLRIKYDICINLFLQKHLIMLKLRLKTKCELFCVFSMQLCNIETE